MGNTSRYTVKPVLKTTCVIRLPLYKAHIELSLLYYALYMYCTCIQSNLSIPDTLGPSKTVLIIEVSLPQRFIYTHLYCSGTTVNCPY